MLYPRLLAVRAAGDFEGYLSFGLGLAARGPYHVSTLTGPDRVGDRRQPRRIAVISRLSARGNRTA